MANWLILCNECGESIDEEKIEAILDAKFGMQHEEDELQTCVLICADWDEELHASKGCEPYVCDGEDCDPKMVAVDPSSKWFIERHKAEREEA